MKFSRDAVALLFGDPLGQSSLAGLAMADHFALRRRRYKRQVQLASVGTPVRLVTVLLRIDKCFTTLPFGGVRVCRAFFFSVRPSRVVAPRLPFVSLFADAAAFRLHLALSGLEGGWVRQFII